MRRLLAALLALVACTVLAFALWRGPRQEPVTVEVVQSSYAISGTQQVAAVADRVAVVQVVEEQTGTTVQGLPATRFRVRTLDVMKGALPVDAVVTQLGGLDERRHKLVLVDGDTRLLPGKVALVAMVEHGSEHLLIPLGGTRVLPVLESGADTWRSSPAVTGMAGALAQLPSANQALAERPGQRDRVR
ncbi:hypothetical protein [Luteococcus peritonei]|uniref:Uncharacterized protein n=1 Tax=Luteococcus peritonei TaxID=88874 RepID=A0ABW4RSH6_9ACTN